MNLLVHPFIVGSSQLNGFKIESNQETWNLTDLKGAAEAIVISEPLESFVAVILIQIVIYLLHVVRADRRLNSDSPTSKRLYRNFCKRTVGSFHRNFEKRSIFMVVYIPLVHSIPTEDTGCHRNVRPVRRCQQTFTPPGAVNCQNPYLVRCPLYPIFHGTCPMQTRWIFRSIWFHRVKYYHFPSFWFDLETIVTIVHTTLLTPIESRKDRFSTLSVYGRRLVKLLA